MSAKAAALSDTLYDRRVFRYAFGATIALALASGIAWSFSYLTPVLALSFLAKTDKQLTFKTAVLFVAIVAAACLVGILISRYVLPKPFVFMPFLGLTILRLFYARATGSSPILIMWMLVAILVVPMIAVQSFKLATLVAGDIIFGAAIAVALVFIIQTFLPDPTTTADDATPEAAGPESTPHPFKEALTATAVVFPLAAMFFMFEWIGSILVMIFVALLSLQPGFASNFKAGLALILGNVLGGAASIVFYELLVTAPSYALLVSGTLFAGLAFGARVFSSTPTAPVFGMAFSTFVLIVGSTTTSDGEAGAAVYARVLQIIAAVVYVVVAFGVIERYRKARTS